MKRTHITVPHCRHLHQPKAHHTTRNLNPHPLITVRIVCAKPKRQQTRRGERQRRQNDRNPILGLHKPVDVFQGLLFDPKIRKEVTIQATEHNAHQGAHGQQACVDSPEIWGSEQDRRSHERYHAKASDKAGVLERSDPDGGEAQRGPRARELVEQVAAVHAQTERPRKGVGPVACAPCCVGGSRGLGPTTRGHGPDRRARHGRRLVV